jgi:ubiquinone/menaquinone biosynthesis C-methylase UbiE
MRAGWNDNLHFGYWESEEDDSSVEEATNRFTDLLTDKLGVGPGDRVLDVGCGIGKPALRLARATGAKVIGITVCRAHVDEANALAEAEGMTDLVSFQFGDAMAMPFPDAMFDAVLALESIIHMDRHTALKEMARVLVPGGRIAVTDMLDLAGEELENLPVGAPPRLADYHDLVKGTGLYIDELTDVSDRTQKTYTKMVEGFGRIQREMENVMEVEEFADVIEYSKQHEAKVEELGEAAPATTDDMDLVRRVTQRLVAVGQPGYMYMIGHR